MNSNRFYYGYGNGLVVGPGDILAGFSPTYPLPAGMKLVTQAFTHEIGEKINFWTDHEGYHIESDVCTRGT